MPVLAKIYTQVRISQSCKYYPDFHLAATRAVTFSTVYACYTLVWFELDLGYWNTRYWRAQGGTSIDATYRGNDYFHSSYLDLIINGLIGLDATNRSTDGLKVTLSVKPLLPKSSNVSYFCLDGVRTAAHDITVLYDATGTHYMRGTGLMLMVDGKVVASAPMLSHIAATIEDGPVSPPLPQPLSPKPAPPPPPSPVVGWTHMANLTGEFCCNGLSDCQPPLIRGMSQATCMTKARGRTVRDDGVDSRQITELLHRQTLSHAREVH
jgi:hypothetical protein